MLELGQGTTAQADLIKDGTEATFMADVVEASREVPIIVDFWAPWCEPCKQLTPALEAAVTAAKGTVKLVKINVDENQQIAAQLRIQSIPTIYAFVDGQPVDGFAGAQTSAQIKEFIQKLVAMSGGSGGLEEALAAAEEMLAEGAAADAAQTFAAIAQEDPDNMAAMAGLARSYIALGQMEQATMMLDALTDAQKADPAIAALLAQIELQSATADAGEAATLRAQVAAAPTDLQLRLDLAMALIGQQDHADAVDELLEIFRQDREWNDSAAKTQLFKLFEALGAKDPVAQSGRRRLSSMIFA